MLESGCSVVPPPTLSRIASSFRDPTVIKEGTESEYEPVACERILAARTTGLGEVSGLTVV